MNNNYFNNNQNGFNGNQNFGNVNQNMEYGNFPQNNNFYPNFNNQNFANANQFAFVEDKTEFKGSITHEQRQTALKKVHSKKGLIFIIIGIVAMIFSIVCYTNSEALSLNQGSCLYLLGLGGVITLLGLIKLLKIANKKSLNSNLNFTVIFDYKTKNVIYNNEKQKLEVSFDRIIKYYEENGVYYVIYNNKLTKKDKKALKLKSKTLGDGVLVCLKNQIAYGTFQNFIGKLNEIVKKNNDFRTEQRNKIKKFAVASFIFSIFAIALVYPILKISDFIIGLARGDLLPKLFSMLEGQNILFVIVFGILLFIFYVMCAVFLSVSSVIVRFLPIIFALVSFSLSVTQLANNRKWWSFVSILVSIVSFILLITVLL